MNGCEVNSGHLEELKNVKLNCSKPSLFLSMRNITIDLREIMVALFPDDFVLTKRILHDRFPFAEITNIDQKIRNICNRDGDTGGLIEFKQF